MYIYLITLIITIFCLLIVVRHISYQKRQSYITNFDYYITVLDYHLGKAFDIIYKDRILVFSMSGTKPDEKDFKVYTNDFSRLVLKLLGPTLVKEFVFFYGDMDTLLFNIVEYFNNRSETDEIKEASLKQLMESDTIGGT
jgi:hypothetical protein